MGRREHFATFKSFVLTTPTGPSLRLASVAKQLKSTGLRAEIVRGFDGTSDALQATYSPWRNLLLSKRSLTRGEVATYLGHRKIWQLIVDRGLDFALVLEDDFRFLDPVSASSSLQVAAAQCGEWDLVKLFDFKPRKNFVCFKRNGMDFAVYQRPSAGMVGYFITRNACIRLLRRKHIFIPVDEELRNWFAHGLSILSVVPNLVNDGACQLGGSLLEQGRIDIKARRNIVRSLWGNFLALYTSARSAIWYRKTLKRFRLRD